MTCFFAFTSIIASTIGSQASISMISVIRLFFNVFYMTVIARENKKWPFGANEDLLSKDKSLHSVCQESALFEKKCNLLFQRMKKNVLLLHKNWNWQFTSHSGQVATSTESNGSKIHGLAITKFLVDSKNICEKFLHCPPSTCVWWGSLTLTFYYKDGSGLLWYFIIYWTKTRPRNFFSPTS